MSANQQQAHHALSVLFDLAGMVDGERAGNAMRTLTTFIDERPDSDSDFDRAWKTLALGGRTLDAVREYRALYRIPLKEAHDRVKAFQEISA